MKILLGGFALVFGFALFAYCLSLLMKFVNFLLDRLIKRAEIKSKTAKKQSSDYIDP